MSASTVVWQGAGCPAPNEKYRVSEHAGRCSTCGTQIDGDAVAIAEIDNPTFSNHADFFRFGGSHVCLACAWLYGAGKGKPGNYIATPDKYEQTVISLESVVEDKRPWLQVIREIANLPPETLVTGVLTTDVKIRLFPRSQLRTVGNFGLYVHCPDYDISQQLDFDLSDLLTTIDLMIPVLTAGFAKASIWYGLGRDHARFSKSIEQCFGWELELSKHRKATYFLPALLMAGVTKEEKSNDSKRSKTTAGNPVQATTGCHQPGEDQLGLF